VSNPYPAEFVNVLFGCSLKHVVITRPILLRPIMSLGGSE
jgi:hypothetical protein